MKHVCNINVSGGGGPTFIVPLKLIKVQFQKNQSANIENMLIIDYSLFYEKQISLFTKILIKNLTLVVRII